MKFERTQNPLDSMKIGLDANMIYAWCVNERVLCEDGEHKGFFCVNDEIAHKILSSIEKGKRSPFDYQLNIMSGIEEFSDDLGVILLNNLKGRKIMYENIVYYIPK